MVRDCLMRARTLERVARDEQLDELPKVTLAFLRRVEDLCPRRVAFEHQNRRGNRHAPGRWRVANQLTEHARVAHIELGFPAGPRSRRSPISFPRNGGSTTPPSTGTCSCSATAPCARRRRRSRRMGDRGARARRPPRRPSRPAGRGRRRPGRAAAPPSRRTGARRRRSAGAARGAVRPAAPGRGGWRGRSVRLVHADLLYGGWSSTRSPPTPRSTTCARGSASGSTRYANGSRTPTPARPRVRPLPVRRRVQRAWLTSCAPRS